MDKAQAMKVMAESHRETVRELEQQIKSYRQGLEDARHELLIHYKLGGSSDNGALQIIDEALEGDEC